MKKILAASAALMLTLPCASLRADDTDIYHVPSVNVKPNVLLIVDNSGSMEAADVVPYDVNKQYPGPWQTSTVYRTLSTSYTLSESSWSPYSGPVSGTLADCLKTIHPRNYYCSESGVPYNSTNRRASEVRGYFITGNARNFMQRNSRMAVAKQTIAELIHNNADKARFGLMAFTYQYTNGQSINGARLLAGCNASKTELIGHFDPTVSAMTTTSQSGLGAIGGLSASTNTPLAKTLAEAGLYFAGKNDWFDYSGNTSYQTPIQYRCQPNYIFLMTDGEPTQDTDSKIGQCTGGVCSGGGEEYINGKKIPNNSVSLSSSSFLDDISYFLANNDLLKASTPNPAGQEFIQKGKAGDFEYQTVTTHTIGFKSNQALLQHTATLGGGQYYTAESAEQLKEVFDKLIGTVKDFKESYSAATVPISSVNKAYAGDYIYYGMFQPVPGSNWQGNIKKYGLQRGVITDKNGNKAVTDDGASILNNAQSYWSASVDGPSFLKGGAGEKLQNDMQSSAFSRAVYTYTASTDASHNPLKDLTHADNSFSVENLPKLQAINPLITTDTITGLRKGIVSPSGDTSKDWSLGSFIHSQPLVVKYTDGDTNPHNDPAMVCAGANDGMLHCFDDNDGAELWGYIPHDLLHKVQHLPRARSLQYFVDGDISQYSYDHDDSAASPDKKLLIFGERRGGNHYTALDVTDRDKPLFHYSIGPDILGAGQEQLGLSWGKAQKHVIGYTDGGTYKTKDAFIFGGGYDTNQDKTTAADPPNPTDSVGRAVFAVDAQTGALQGNLNFNASNFSAMTHSIVAVAPFENPKSRTITRIYAGDMNGNMFAFRDDIFHHNRDRSKAADFSGNYDGLEDGNWDQQFKLFSSPGLKIFHAPNAVQYQFPVQITHPPAAGSTTAEIRTEKRVGEYIYYGTGDRENPKDKTTVNEFYAIKNNWDWGTATPTIVRAYVEQNDGTIRARDDQRVLFRWDASENKYTPDSASSGQVYFLLDVTDNLYQSKAHAATAEAQQLLRRQHRKYITEAIDHPDNRGWYIRLVEDNGSASGRAIGEKMVSTPVIYAGVVYFSTFAPSADTGANSNDPCHRSGAEGTGYLYALGYRYGQAVLDFANNTGENENPSEDSLFRENRRTTLQRGGMPPNPVLVVSADGANLFTGLEKTRPRQMETLQPFYWRELRNDGP